MRIYHLLIIAVAGLSGMSLADPTTTARIFSAMPEKTIEPLTLGMNYGQQSTDTNPLEITKRLTASIDKTKDKLDKLKTDIARSLDPDKTADLYIQVQHYSFIASYLEEEEEERKNDNSTINTRISILSSTIRGFFNASKQHNGLSEIINSLNNLDTFESTISEYEKIVNSNPDFKIAYIGLAIKSLSNTLNVPERPAVIVSLSNKQKMLSREQAFKKLIHELVDATDSRERRNFIQKFFENNFSLNNISIPQDAPLSKIASIEFANKTYKEATSHPENIWADGDSFKWNYLQYSRNLSKDSLKTFGGFGLGAAGSSQSIKINVLEYDIYYNDTDKYPLTLYSSEVLENGGLNPDDVNKSKLLDTEMGTINLSISSISKFRIDKFCTFNSSYGCYFPIQLGARALRLPSETEDDDDSKLKYSMGIYAKIGLNMVFPITPRADSSTIAGRMAFSTNFVYYKQFGSDLSVIFPNIVDSEGNPMLEGSDYQAFNVNLLFTITDTITVAAKYFNSKGDAEEMGSITSLEFNYKP